MSWAPLFLLTSPPAHQHIPLVAPSKWCTMSRHLHDRCHCGPLCGHASRIITIAAASTSTPPRPHLRFVSDTAASAQVTSLFRSHQMALQLSAVAQTRTVPQGPLRSGPTCWLDSVLSPRQGSPQPSHPPPGYLEHLASAQVSPQWRGLPASAPDNRPCPAVQHRPPLALFLLRSLCHCLQFSVSARRVTAPVRWSGASRGLDMCTALSPGPTAAPRT